MVSRFTCFQMYTDALRKFGKSLFEEKCVKICNQKCRDTKCKGKKGKGKGKENDATNTQVCNL